MAAKKKKISEAERSGKFDLKKAGGRPTKAVAEERTRIVAEALMQGKSNLEIQQICVQQFGMPKSSSYTILKRANKYIRENYILDPEVVVTRHIEMYYKLYDNFKEIDAKGSIAALKAVEDLLKIHNDQPLFQNNTLNVNVKELSVKDIRKLLSEGE